MSEEIMKNISLETVREKLLDYVHQVTLGFHSYHCKYAVFIKFNV